MTGAGGTTTPGTRAPDPGGPGASGAPGASVPDDDLWSAVGDPTRRRVLDLLLAGEGTATTLADRLPVTRQAVTKHLAVLDRVGLVHGTTTGRERRYRVDTEQLARASAQLDAVGRAWDARLWRIQRLAEAIHATGAAAASTPATAPTAAPDPEDD